MMIYSEYMNEYMCKHDKMNELMNAVTELTCI